MATLPEEIVREVFRLAAGNDLCTAAQLCRINSTTKRAFLPVLWRHVTLRGERHVRSFNKAMRSSPKLRKMIRGVTLLEDLSEGTSINRNSIRRWIKEYVTLYKHLATYSRRYNLSTLVMSREVCERFYSGIDDEEEIQDNLDNVLRQTKFKIDHLVTSHADVPYFMERMRIKRITAYGCEGATKLWDPTLFESERSVRTVHLKELNIIIGDRRNPLYPPPCLPLNDLDAHHKAWAHRLYTHIEWLGFVQHGDPKIRIYLHEETHEGRGTIKQDLEVHKVMEWRVKIGAWGMKGDTNQRQAEVDSFARRGWLCGNSAAYRAEKGAGLKDEWCSCHVEDVAVENHYQMML